jgi:hypothetical protein
MSEKIICLDYDDTITSKIKLDAFIHKKLEHVDRFLLIVEKHDRNILEQLLEKYEKKLIAKNIREESNEIVKQFTIDYSSHSLLQKYKKYIPLLENAVLHYLDFQKYKSEYKNGEELEVLFTDNIRGGFYVLYYLAYTLQELLPRETVLEMAMECTDQLYAQYQDQITKQDTLQGMSSTYHDQGCWKTHNFVSQIKDERYYLKVTKCIWGEVFSELPDLKLASLLECHGDFSKMQFINPSFALSRTKTCVEGHPYCDFVHYDKRIEKEIEHPDEDFWVNFN